MRLVPIAETRYTFLLGAVHAAKDAAVLLHAVPGPI